MKWDIEKIWNYKRKDNITSSIREKVLKGLAVFLVIMIVFTLLSSAAASITVAKVSVTYAKSNVIEHAVSITGKVEPDQEQSISTLANIIVKKINVNEGQSVLAGDTLFELDMEDIEEKKQELEYELQKLDLDIADMVSAQSVNEAATELQKRRASQDYKNAVEKQDTIITQAYEDMVDAYNKLVGYQNSNSNNTSDADQVGDVLAKTITQTEQVLASAQAAVTQLNQMIENKIVEKQSSAQDAVSTPLTQAQLNTIANNVRTEYNSLLQEANTAVTNAESDYTDAVNALSEYQVNNAAQAAQSASSDEQALLDTYNDTIKAYDAAVAAKSDSTLSSSRAIEDADAKTASNSEIEKAELDRELKIKELEKYEQLVSHNGIVTAPVDGSVTQINLTVGGTTSDTASMLMVDSTSGYKFVAQATEKQQEYLAQNDKVILSTADNKTILKDLTIDIVAANKEDSTLMDITVIMPDSSINIGTTLTLKLTKQSNTYDICIPTEAIHTDGISYYVLVVKEVDTVLGKELQAERMNITILEKNDEYAALGEGSVTSQNKIIVTSNRSIESGDCIRLGAE